MIIAFYTSTSTFILWPHDIIPPVAVEKKLYLQGIAHNSIIVNPGEIIVMPLRITHGIEEAEPGVEYYLDVTTACRETNEYGIVSFSNPINNMEQTHVLIDNVNVKLGIRLDDGREGHIIWKHTT